VATRKQEYAFQKEPGLANAARGGFYNMLTNALGTVAKTIVAFVPMAFTLLDIDVSDSESDSSGTDIASIKKEPSPKRSQRHLTKQESIPVSQTTKRPSSPLSTRSPISPKSISISVSRTNAVSPNFSHTALPPLPRAPHIQKISSNSNTAFIKPISNPSVPA